MATNDRTRLLDAGIDLVGRHGYAGITPARIARAAGTDVAGFRRLFPTRASWITGAYDRLYERRLRRIRRIAAAVPAGNTDPDVALAAALKTVVVGDEADPLFAATFDFFFQARDDQALSRRLLAIRKLWEVRIDAVTPKLFPAGTPKATQDLVMVHLIAIGSTAVSNGLDAFDPRPIDLPILRAAIAGD
jgi:AcrR family transcriptional regulator